MDLPLELFDFDFPRKLTSVLFEVLQFFLGGQLQQLPVNPIVDGLDVRILELPLLEDLVLQVLVPIP